MLPPASIITVLLLNYLSRQRRWDTWARTNGWGPCTITGWARDQTGVWRSRITKSQLTPADRTPSITWESFTTMDVLFQEITAWLFNGFARLPHTAIKRLFIGWGNVIFMGGALHGTRKRDFGLNLPRQINE